MRRIERAEVAHVLPRHVVVLLDESPDNPKRDERDLRDDAADRGDLDQPSIRCRRTTPRARENSHRTLLDSSWLRPPGCGKRTGEVRQIDPATGQAIRDIEVGKAPRFLTVAFGSV